ncbi:MAG: hypothetical protein ACK4HC_10695 [Cloacibacterium sp.]
MRRFVILSATILSFNSCSVLQKSAKQELSDGFYKKKTATESTKVYVDMADETIRIHPTQKGLKQIVIDTLQSCELYQPEIKTKENITFKVLKNSFDVDFLSIPLKYRFSEKGVPPQLNTNLNGAIYLGYRTDIYQINYRQNPVKMAVRHTNHFGYSVGLFTGLGNTFMSPTNTNNILQQEYDGIVWSKGIAGIVGINNFTVGLTLGVDNLLDKNKSIWIYENKPWVGLAFGLNLN